MRCQPNWSPFASAEAIVLGIAEIKQLLQRERGRHRRGRGDGEQHVQDNTGHCLAHAPCPMSFMVRRARTAMPLRKRRRDC